LATLARPHRRWAKGRPAVIQVYQLLIRLIVAHDDVEMPVAIEIREHGVAPTPPTLVREHGSCRHQWIACPLQ
jgi:hypothetical protein